MKSHTFQARIDIIGINPYVQVPETILTEIFKQAGKDKGHIPIAGTINGLPYQQTLVKYCGLWRLYINTTMLKDSPKRIGESIELSIQFDSSDRSIQPHPKLTEALANDAEAQSVFDQLSPSMQKEIVRYIANLKTEESIQRNVEKAIGFLLGKGSFIGRKGNRNS